MIALSVSGLTFEVGTKEILKGISFSIEDGDKLGIVGVNGSGKSTLLRLITGKYEATDGEIYIAKNTSVGMMEQDDAFNIVTGQSGTVFENTVLSQMYAAFPDLCRDEERISELEKLLVTATGTELERYTKEFTEVNNRFIDKGGLHYKSRCKSLLARLGFNESSYNRPVTSLSGGERARLNLARLLYREPDILILDEPTNHLDTDTLEWLEAHLGTYKKTVIVVSHDRYFLDKVTTKTLDIEHHEGKLYSVPYSGYVKQKEADRAAAEKKYMLQQKEIARLEAYIEQQRRWNRERNIIAAESREKAIARMEKVERPKDSPKAIKFNFTKSGESGNDVLSVKNLKMNFGDRILFSEVSFEVKKREHLFILGANGTGKSTLLKILLGKLHQTNGTYEFGYNVTVGYYDQENQNLDMSKTVIDEIWDTYPEIKEADLRGVLATFMFKGEDAFKQVSVLSGGERARLTLAKLILSGMNLLILDEPTNHLDIQSREALENALEGFDGTIIAVSHDRYFIKKLATRVIEITNKNINNYIGGYEDYSAAREKAKEEQKIKKTQPSESSADDPSKLSNKELYLQRKKENAEARQAEKHKKKVLAEIEKLEEELSKISEEMYGSASTDYVRVAELETRKNEIEERLLELYEEEENF